ncbi:MAG: hypothetical protein DWQ02_05545 [Bacteroidetes bacterium]|nr:MAG: hypothetical protein DWQ02_05545 [Bacteroidota bacterium]
MTHFLLSAQDSLVLDDSFSMEYSSEQKQDGWWEMVSYEGKFKVMAPGQMKVKSDTTQTDIGKLRYHVFFHEHFLEEGSKDKKDPEANLLFLLSIYEYPSFAIHSDSTEVLDNFFQATVDGAVESVQGQLIYTNDVQMDTYPGKMWRINYNGDKNVIRTRAYLVENRLYLISVVSNKAFSINAANDRYFGSFKIFH